MRRTPNFFAETGRSMLEILAVITIICVFSIGSFIVYNQTNNKQKARNDYEEMLMAVSSRLNKGTFRTDKGIADTQWNKKKTRRGNQILTEKNCPQNAITVTVDHISPEVCKELLKKNWNTPQNPLSFYRAAEFGEICSGLPAKITRDGYYITSEADCERVKPSGEWQTFSVSYPMNSDVVARRLCKTNAECYSCESCSDANVCESTCGADQYCYSDGTCREYEDCAENEYRDEKGDCQKCPKNAVCADKKTISGCKEGFYLEEGACKSCPTPQGHGCLDDKDANGCPIYERMICRGTTPVCQSDSAEEDYNTCYCPAHAICTGSSGSGSGSSGNNSGENGEENSEDGFVCEDGYYKSGDTCVECHISGATGCSDEETATSCQENYYLSAGSCISCPVNATCAGGTADFVCSSGWEQNEAGTACVAAATECSGHGTKDENDTCVCQGGYTGTNCETQITCVNGTWSESGCTCTSGWYGPLCDSDCDGWKDIYDHCNPCSMPETFQSTRAECAKCDDTTTPRQIFNRDGYNEYCGLRNCPNEMWRTVSGECISCSDTYPYEATQTGCALCDNTDYPRQIFPFFGTNGCGLKSCPNETFQSYRSGYCYPCSEPNSYNTVTATECAKCDDTATPRMMSGNYCVLAPDCFGHGTKTNGTCVCDAGYTGTNCQTECSGHGTITNGTCVCDSGYTGTNCETECSGNGTITNGACVCNSGWYGPLCDSDCDGFRDNNGTCYSCSESDSIYNISKDECAKCDGTDNPRYMGYRGNCYLCSAPFSTPYTNDTECTKCSNREVMTTSLGNRCVLSTEACNDLYPGVGGFRDYSGTCNSCSDDDHYSTSVIECAKCDNRFMSDGTCFSCSDHFGFSISFTECAKCSNREMFSGAFLSSGYSSGKNVCSLSTSGCNSLYPDEGGFIDAWGDCVSCLTGGGIASRKDECVKCGTQRTYNTSTSICSKA